MISCKDQANGVVGIAHVFHGCLRCLKKLGAWWLFLKKLVEERSSTSASQPCHILRMSPLACCCVTTVLKYVDIKPWHDAVNANRFALYHTVKSRGKSTCANMYDSACYSRLAWILPVAVIPLNEYCSLQAFSWLRFYLNQYSIAHVLYLGWFHSRPSLPLRSIHKLLCVVSRSTAQKNKNCYFWIAMETMHQVLYLSRWCLAIWRILMEFRHQMPRITALKVPSIFL